MELLCADVLVAGGGLGGLMAAYHAQQAGANLILLGGSPGASNRVSSLNTALSDSEADQPAFLFNDILLSGGFINQPSVVAAMVQRIGPETRMLADLGVPFQRENGQLARRQAAGSTWRRAVFSLGMIGADISHYLIAKLRAGTPPVQYVEGGRLLDLTFREGAMAGALGYVPRSERWLQISVPAVVLATGGAGQLFAKTTNPRGSQGVGYALALEAGAPLIDMEFVSHEPFVLLRSAGRAGRDLPTTVLREGARLLNGRGEEFIDTARAPSKDVICRAMLREVRAGRGTPAGGVYYDLRGMPVEVLRRYQGIKQVLAALRLGPDQAQLEVMPAQHYLMGGVATDENAATDVPGLFAVGEVAGGAHGAHRLAACGGTEVVAMGAIAGERAAAYARGRPSWPNDVHVAPRPELLGDGLEREDLGHLGRIQSTLDRACGIMRDATSLGSAVAELRALHAELAGRGRQRSFIGRATLVALAIALPALARAESRGDHYRVDCPARDDVNWLGNLLVALDREGHPSLAYRRAGLATRHVASLVPGQSRGTLLEERS